MTPTDFLLIHKPPGWTSFDVVNYIRKQVRAPLSHPELVSGSDNQVESPLRQMLKQVQHAMPKETKNIKVGHAGTLDPFATGLLIVAVGRDATKRLDEFKNLPKTYVAKLHLGMVSDTGDPTGTIHDARNTIQEDRFALSSPSEGEVSRATSRDGGVLALIRQAQSALSTSRRASANDDWGNGTTTPAPLLRKEGTNPTRDTVESCLKSFVGKQLQTPPMHSAKSVNGVRLYKLARQGKTVERQPSEIEIYRLSLIAYSWPYLTIEVECSVGTYIRTLAEDIGEKLGVGAYCTELTRTKIGPYNIEDAFTIK